MRRWPTATATSGSAAGVLPGIYVDAVAIAVRGALPMALADHYERDEAALAAYVAAAVTEAGFAAWLADWLADTRRAAAE